MTDPFEEAVRAAGRGLADAAPAPTYHGAWKRGRRRRLAKRSAVAVVGALALVVAFGTDIGRLPGGGTSIDVDDVALETELVPAPLTTVVPTTAPVTSAVPDEGASAPDLDLDASSEAAPTEVQSEPGPAEADATETGPAPTPLPSTPAPSTPIPSNAVPATPVPSNTIPEPEPTTTVAPEPTVQATPLPENEPTPDTSAAAVAPTPTPGTATSAAPADLSNPEGSPEPGQSGDTNDGDQTQTGLADQPPASTTRLGAPADARIAPDAIRNGAESTCDLDGDGAADAFCEPLPMYRCSGADEVRADYQALDLDGDGTVDTCVAVVQTTCDTTGDGIGDVSCLIRIDATAKILEDEGP